MSEGADRWQRRDWWGVVLDTDDVATLTTFYAALRGWRVHHLDAADGSLDAGEGVAYLNIQHNPDFVRPIWPTQPGSQQMMVHLDFEVTDIAGEVARAITLGAELAGHQPQHHVRVMLDPSGHPFCLYVSQPVLAQGAPSDLQWSGSELAVSVDEPGGSRPPFPLHG